MIARAQQADLDDVLPLVAGYRSFYEQSADPRGERAFVERCLRDETSVMFLARIDDRAVGFVQLFPTYSTVHLGPSFVLEDLFVVSDARRSGVASALLDRAVEFAREAGAVGMFLETAQDNVAAQTLYRRKGWRLEDRFLKFNARL
ncbi:MAG TPA: GNAT family N-acetyltransferase [Verrucomicrobiae bacterium]|jgi:GNAT superfamily N-acetyltransferase|nr:GNAT family N-acetyltransferase [Verrucomicrobiae bacterium]